MQGRAGLADRSAQRAVTSDQIVRDLRMLDVKAGQTLLVHASLRELGPVPGGAPAVVSALRQAVGPEGHVVVPTGTEENSMTSRAHLARIAEMTPEQALAYRDTMPAFDRNRMPSGMGAVSEALRTASGAVRSAHPQSSFAAIGPQADLLMADHRLDCHLGPDSPLGKLDKMNAQALMLGVGYWAFTGFHLAEYTYTPNPPMRGYACVVRAEDGGRCWMTYDDVVLDDNEFENIGASMEMQIAVNRGLVGGAQCRLVPLHPAVEFAAKWMRGHRA
jgi:aminoglycoside 3-N-acetyltransferase